MVPKSTDVGTLNRPSSALNHQAQLGYNLLLIAREKSKVLTKTNLRFNVDPVSNRLMA